MGRMYHDRFLHDNCDEQGIIRTQIEQQSQSMNIGVALLLGRGSEDALFQVVVVSESDKNEETTAFLTMHERAPRHNSLICR